MRLIHNNYSITALAYCVYYVYRLNIACEITSVTHHNSSQLEMKHILDS